MLADRAKHEANWAGALADSSDLEHFRALTTAVALMRSSEL